MSADVQPQMEDRSFHDILSSLVGSVVTIANPESFEHSPMGRQLKAGIYKAKLIAMGRDYLVLLTEDVKQGKRGEEPVKEPVRQYLPISRIKRFSHMKSDRVLHI
jgi:hypothetical protein